MKFKFTFSDFGFLDTLIKSVNTYITKAHQQILKTVVILEARTYAYKNLPGGEEPSMSAYTSSITGAYTGLKKEVAAKLQGGVQKAVGSANITTVAEEIQAKKMTIDEEKEIKRHLIIDRDRIHVESDYRSYQQHRWLLWLFGLGECLWNAAFFLRLGDISIIAAFIGVLIGIAQVVGVKVSVQIIKEIQDIRKQIYYGVATGVSFLLFSLLLGGIRYWFVHQGDGANIPFVVMNPMVFAAINMLFVFATAVVVYLYYPARAEAKQVSRLEAIDKEIEKSKTKIEKVEADLKMLLQKKVFMFELHARIIHAEKTLFERIDALFQQAIGTFKNENLIKRSDGQFPKSFSTHHEPLSNDNDDLLLAS